MRGFRKKCKKPLFWGILGQNGPNWAKMGHFRIFGEKVKTSPSYPFFFIFQNKKSENYNARFRRKSGARRERGQTDRDEGEFIGPNPPGGRRTKKELMKYCFDVMY